MTVHYEPWRTGVGLDDVFWLWTSVLEPGWSMFNNGLGEDFVEFGSFNFEFASVGDFSGELKKFSYVVAGFGAS